MVKIYYAGDEYSQDEIDRRFAIYLDGPINGIGNCFVSYRFTLIKELEKIESYKNLVIFTPETDFKKIYTEGELLKIKNNFQKWRKRAIHNSDIIIINLDEYKYKNENYINILYFNIGQLLEQRRNIIFYGNNKGINNIILNKEIIQCNTYNEVINNINYIRRNPLIEVEIKKRFIKITSEYCDPVILQKIILSKERKNVNKKIIYIHLNNDDYLGLKIINNFGFMFFKTKDDYFVYIKKYKCETI